jgi:glycosyltransferase involved in cell wall biosynthesis
MRQKRCFAPILGLFSTPQEEDEEEGEGEEEEGEEGTYPGFSEEDTIPLLEEEEDTIPLLVFVGRLVYQKGVDLICDIIPWLMSPHHSNVTGRAHVLLMGMGEVLTHSLFSVSLTHIHTHTHTHTHT